jgi:hypothetical protein
MCDGLGCGLVRVWVSAPMAALTGNDNNNYESLRPRSYKTNPNRIDPVDGPNGLPKVGSGRVAIKILTLLRNVNKIC